MNAWRLALLPCLVAMGCSCTVGPWLSCVKLEPTTAHSPPLYLPQQWISRTQQIDGKTVTVEIDLPYSALASDLYRLAPDSGWKTDDTLMLVLDTRFPTQTSTAAEVTAFKVKQRQFAEGSKRHLPGMTEYISAQYQPDGLRETVYIPDDFSSGVWEISCVRSGDVEPIACSGYGAYSAGLTMQVLIPVGDIPRAEKFWLRVKELIDAERISCLPAN